eukprot:UN05148
MHLRSQVSSSLSKLKRNFRQNIFNEWYHPILFLVKIYTFEGNLQFFGYGILPIIEGSQDDRIEPIEDEPR